MSWIRLDDGWDMHPKVLAVSEPAAMMWQRAIAHSNRHKTARGFVPLGGLARLTTHPDPLALAAELAGVRVPGCRGGLFDRAVRGAGHEIVQLDSHDQEHAGELVGYFVHDVAAYWRPGEDQADSQGKSRLSNARSEAGKKGAERRWRGAHGTEPAPAMASAMGGDGNLPKANVASASLNAGAAITGATHGPGLAPTTPRAQAGADGKVPMASDGNLLPPDPDPGPDPDCSPASERARRDTATTGLATAEVWLAAVAPHPSLALLHGDLEWATELEGTAAHRGTRAEDAHAAVLVFLDKHAGKRWNDHDELVAAFGGYSARAKQHGDDARTRAARATEQHRPRVNGHQHGRPAHHAGPPPNPRGAEQLELDTGEGGPRT